MQRTIGKRSTFPGEQAAPLPPRPVFGPVHAGLWRRCYAVVVPTNCYPGLDVPDFARDSRANPVFIERGKRLFPSTTVWLWRVDHPHFRAFSVSPRPTATRRKQRRTGCKALSEREPFTKHPIPCQRKAVRERSAIPAYGSHHWLRLPQYPVAEGAIRCDRNAWKPFQSVVFHEISMARDLHDVRP